MAARWSTREVPTRNGPARIHRAGTSGAQPTLVLGHGAGGGVDAPDLQGLAEAAVGAGSRVILVEQPWRLAGRRVAPRPAVLDESWADVVASLRVRGPLVLGGRSAGARVACRTAGDLGASGVVALAFPLHPPGRPERTRAVEVASCPVPVLVVQGERDRFGTAAEVRRNAPDASVVGVPGADHALARADLSPAFEAVLAFLGRWRE